MNASGLSIVSRAVRVLKNRAYTSGSVTRSFLSNLWVFSKSVVLCTITTLNEF